MSRVHKNDFDLSFETLTKDRLERSRRHWSLAVPAFISKKSRIFRKKLKFNKI